MARARTRLASAPMLTRCTKVSSGWPRGGLGRRLQHPARTEIDSPRQSRRRIGVEWS
jgi:hypothetical protein